MRADRIDRATRTLTLLLCAGAMLAADPPAASNSPPNELFIAVDDLTDWMRREQAKALPKTMGLTTSGATALERVLSMDGADALQSTRGIGRLTNRTTYWREPGNLLVVIACCDCLL